MLYTFVTEYLGGTYISQVNAENSDDALAQSIGPLEKLFNTAIEIATSDKTSPISGRAGVWCATALNSSEELILMHIVQTDENTATG